MRLNLCVRVAFPYDLFRAAWLELLEKMIGAWCFCWSKRLFPSLGWNRKPPPGDAIIKFFFRISSHLAWWHRQVGEREVIGPKAGKSHVINTRVPPQNHIGEISLFLKKYGRWRIRPCVHIVGPASDPRGVGQHWHALQQHSQVDSWHWPRLTSW